LEVAGWGVGRVASRPDWVGRMASFDLKKLKTIQNRTYAPLPSNRLI